jgi:hypothetical protein
LAISVAVLLVVAAAMAAREPIYREDRKLLRAPVQPMPPQRRPYLSRHSFPSECGLSSATVDRAVPKRPDGQGEKSHRIPLSPSSRRPKLRAIPGLGEETYARYLVDQPSREGEVGIAMRAGNAVATVRYTGVRYQRKELLSKSLIVRRKPLPESQLMPPALLRNAPRTPRTS